MAFDVYSKSFVVHGDNYTLHPLTGMYLGKLYSVAMRLEKINGDDGADTTLLSDKDVADMHELVTATLVSSYPQEDKLKVERFAAQNLGAFIGPVLEVNFGRPKE
jgi:hypothetical protein